MKAVSELYSPVSGEVSEVNTALTQNPEKVNSDPHGSWMIAVKVADAADVGRSARCRRVYRSHEII